MGIFLSAKRLQLCSDLWSQFCFILVFVSLVLTAKGQQASYFHLGTQEGLPSDVVYAAMQDQKGYLWLGTDKGVAQYDGSNIKIFNQANGLPDLDIFGFYEDSKGRLWLRTYNGKAAFILDGIIHSATNDSILAQVKSLGHITTIIEDPSGNIWIGNIEKGLWKISPNIEKAEYIEQVNDATISRCNFFWINAEQHVMLFASSYVFDLSANTYNQHDCVAAIDWRGLYMNDASFYFSSTDTVYHGVKSQPIIRFKQVITAIQKTRDNHIWVSTRKGLFEVDLRESSPKVLRTLLPDYTSSGLFEDLDGGLWITTIGQGAFYLAERELKLFGKRDGFPSDEVTSLDEGPNGEIYLGFRGGGAATFETNGKIVLRRNGGANQLGGNGWLFPSPEFEIFVADDSLIIYKNKRIVKRVVGSKTGRQIKNGKLAISPSGDIVVVSLEDLLKKSDILFADSLSLYATRAYAFEETNTGQLLAGTQIGLLCFENEKRVSVSIPDSIASLGVTDIKSNDKYDFWVATPGWGIYRFGKSPLLTIRAQNGLCSNICNALEIDEFGNIWVATADGLSKISFSGKSKENYQIQNWYTQDGIAGNDINDVLVKDQTVFLATKEGLNVFDERKVNQRHSEVMLHWLPIAADEKRLEPKQEIDFALGTRNIQFNWVGINFRNQHRIQYKYRIKGLEEDWNETKENSAQYSELPYGQHTFELQAFIAPDGKLGPVKNIVFKIPRPFYAQITFWLFITLGLAMLIGIASYRLRKIKLIPQKESDEKPELDTEKAEPEILAQNLDYMFVKVDGKQVKVSFEEVQYFQSSGHYIQIVTSNKRLMTLSTMQGMIDKLQGQDNFIRVHRSYIIAISHVSNVQGNTLMIGKTEIPIGGSYKASLMDALGLNE